MRLQDFHQITRLPGLNTVHKAPTRRLIKIKGGRRPPLTDYKSSMRLQEFHETTRVPSDYNSSIRLQDFSTYYKTFPKNKKNTFALKRLQNRDLGLSIGAPGSKLRCASFWPWPKLPNVVKKVLPKYCFLYRTSFCPRNGSRTEISAWNLGKSSPNLVPHLFQIAKHSKSKSKSNSKSWVYSCRPPPNPLIQLQLAIWYILFSLGLCVQCWDHGVL